MAGSSLVRVPVYQYRKSQRFFGVYAPGGGAYYTLLDLGDDRSSLVKIRSVKSLRWDSITDTPYQLDVLFNRLRRDKKDRRVERVEWTFVRTLTPEDIDPQRWRSTDDLQVLPVAPITELTPEEKRWAGVDQGFVPSGLVAAIVAAPLWWWTFAGDFSWGPSFFFGSIATFFAWFLPWRLPKPDEDRLRRLKEHKQNLIHRSQLEAEGAKTKLKRALEEHSYWEQLSPRDFEVAIGVFLEGEGMKLTPTSYTGDGGVDLEGHDETGYPVIVQAKRYKAKVGVATIREIVGVRQARTDTPRTVVFSLIGFTRGARTFAKEHNVELRDVRSETLKPT